MGDGVLEVYFGAALADLQLLLDNSTNHLPQRDQQVRENPVPVQQGDEDPFGAQPEIDLSAVPLNPLDTSQEMGARNRAVCLEGIVPLEAISPVAFFNDPVD